MKRIPVSQTVKTLLVMNIIIILHGYQLHIYKDYILAHQEEDSLFQGTKIKSSGNRGKMEENPFRVTPAKMRGGCQLTKCNQFDILTFLLSFLSYIAIKSLKKIFANPNVLKIVIHIHNKLTFCVVDFLTPACSQRDIGKMFLISMMMMKIIVP